MQPLAPCLCTAPAKIVLPSALHMVNSGCKHTGLFGDGQCIFQARTNYVLALIFMTTYNYNIWVKTYLVKTPPANPNLVLFALLMTSSSLSNGNSPNTAPNTSSLTTVMSSFKLSNTHGRM